MKKIELVDLSTDELRRRNGELAENLFRFRIRHASGQLETPSVLRKTKKEIARIKTALRDREAH